MRPTEKIEKLVRQMSFKAGPEMDKDLWADAASTHDQSQKAQQACNQALLRRIIMKRPITKVAVVALVCTGIAAAAVVGVKIYKWHVIGKDPEAGYLLLSEDGHTMTNIPESWADSPEHAVKVREELDLLKQQGKRKLLGVSEFEVNGQLDSRLFTYEYTLSDGRTIRRGEDDLGDNNLRMLVGERWDEAFQRFREITEGGEADPTTYEQVVQGQVFSFESWQFALSDGTEVTWSFGKVKDNH